MTVAEGDDGTDGKSDNTATVVLNSFYFTATENSRKSKLPLPKTSTFPSVFQKGEIRDYDKFWVDS